MVLQASSGSPERAVVTFCATEKSHPENQGIDCERFAPVQDSWLLTEKTFSLFTVADVEVLSCMTERVMNFDSYSTSRAYSAAGPDLRPLLHVI